MMLHMKNWIAVSLLSSLAISGYAQKNKDKKAKKEEIVEPIPFWSIDTLMRPIPLNRALFTDNIQKQLKIADVRDGAIDQQIIVKDTMLSRILTENVLEQAYE